ncbi:MAG: DUF434 domain-containing protein [Flavobacteriaceae bacterium]|nr:DUF434 domain-containing protein [Flavobacteriaceae bacterium]
MRNRGKNSNDDTLFGSKTLQLKFKEALEDMRYLLSRGYGEKSALQLVGNRYRFNLRQQQAILGMSASQQQIELRQSHEVYLNQMHCETFIIDGFNLLIVLESALSGAYLFKGLDGAYRDLSSVHGTYKRVKQTETAIHLVGDTLKHHKVIWVFDQPVSNSGRLKTLLGEIAKQKAYNWDIILDYNPDKMLAQSKHIAISSDAWILDRAKRWLNLAAVLINQHIQNHNIIQSQ